jgi:hypothetical protein
VEKNVVVIKKKSSLIAVNEDGDGWKFIEQNKLEFFMKNRLLPDDLVDKLK